MISMILSPVRPSASSSSSSGGEAHAPSIVHEAKEEEPVNLKDALDEGPIVGVEPAQDGHSIRTAVPLPAPPAMTPKEREIHNLTHQPPTGAALSVQQIAHPMSNMVPRTKRPGPYHCWWESIAFFAPVLILSWQHAWCSGFTLTTYCSPVWYRTRGHMQV